jgi:Amt family ammonium transporter
VGALCYGAVVLKSRLGYDDSLDAFGIHGIGGLSGAILTGVFATKVANEAGSGLLDGNAAQLTTQFIAAGATAVYACVVTAILLFGIKATIGLRVAPQEEKDGLDATQHGEEGYNL